MTDRPSKASRPPAPRAGHFALALAAFAVFAVYGSLVPLDYTPQDWNSAVERFRRISWLELGVVHRADWVANILLFVPLGFLGLAASEVDRRFGPRTVVVMLASLVVWSALSLAIEFTQLWFPPRTVSLNDLIAETIGALVGMLGWLVCGQRITDWCRQALSTTAGRGLATVLLPGYLVFLAVTHWMPFDLTISPAELYDKYQAGKLLLIPFSLPPDGVRELAAKYFWNVIFFAPLGWLWAHVPVERWGWRPTAGLALVVGMVATATIEVGQLFVVSRYTDVTDLATGTAGIGLAWLAARRWSPVLASGPAGVAAGANTGRGADWRWAAVWLGALAVWFGLAAWVFWAPFEFEFDPRRVEDRLQRMSLIPFFDYYRQSEFKSFDNVLRRLIVYLPLGVVLGLAWRALFRRASVWWPLPLAVALVGVIEVAQFFLPEKFPSITDGLLGSLGAGAGLYAVRRLTNDLTTRPAPPAPAATGQAPPLPSNRAIPLPPPGGSRS